MKYKYLTLSLIGFLSLLSQAGFAVEQQDIIKNNLNTDYPAELISQNPQTQEEANRLIDVYIKQSFDSIYYTEKPSIGEIKMIIKNKYLFTKQKIDFTTIKYHIDKSFNFEGAIYTWTVKRGDKTLAQINGVNKADFFYSFNEPGVYQVEVSVNWRGAVKTGTMVIDVFDKISLDYRPFNPAKGDRIVVLTALPASKYRIEWKIDGKTVESTDNNLTFVENKGFGNSYSIEAIAKDIVTGFTKYYGVANIEIKEPSIRLALTNSVDSSPIEFTENMQISEAKSILVTANLDNMSQKARLSYAYRVNDAIQPNSGNTLALEVKPNSGYTIDVIVSDSETKENITKRFTINGGKKLPLEANLSNNQHPISKFLQNDRYSGILIFGLVSIGFVLISKQSRILS